MSIKKKWRVSYIGGGGGGDMMAGAGEMGGGGGGLFGGFASALTAGSNNTDISASRKAMGEKITKAFDTFSEGFSSSPSTYKPTQPAPWATGSSSYPDLSALGSGAGMMMPPAPQGNPAGTLYWWTGEPSRQFMG